MCETINDQLRVQQCPYRFPREVKPQKNSVEKVTGRIYCCELSCDYRQVVLIAEESARFIWHQRCACQFSENLPQQGSSAPAKPPTEPSLTVLDLNLEYGASLILQDTRTPSTFRVSLCSLCTTVMLPNTLEIGRNLVGAPKLSDGKTCLLYFKVCT